MSIRPCPACESTEVAARLMVPETMYGTGETFEYATCATCGTLRIIDIPEDLAAYYDTSRYYSFDDDPKQTMGRKGVAQVVALVGRSVLFGPHDVVARLASPVPVRQVRTLVSLFESARLGGLARGRKTRILDVGAGSGAFLFALDLAGMRHVVGIDPFIDQDRTVGRTKVLRRELADVDGEYDTVMMHHSLEHVPDPRATLRHAAARLAPGGRLVVRMPTVSSHAWDVYGTSWIGTDAPRHLTVFSRAGMETICREVGLRVEQVKDDSNEFQFWTGEQNRAGVPLVSAHSEYVHPGKAGFDRRQMRSWRKQADRLNRESRGDQAAWVVTVAE